MYSSGTAAAFTADSFVIDTDDYLFKSIQSASTFSLRNSASTYTVSASSPSDSSVLILNSGSPTLVSGPDAVLSGPATDSGAPNYEIITPDYPELHLADWGSLISSAGFIVPKPSVSSHDDYNKLTFPVGSFEISYDVSSYNSSSVYFYGDFKPYIGVWNGSFFSPSSFALDIFIDGSLYRTYNSESLALDLGGYLYSGSSSISTISFRVHDMEGIDSSVSTGTQLYFDVGFSSDCTACISFLSDTEILNGFNDNAQDAMNQQDAIESQWTGSMTENFNNLSLSDFTFPVAAVNGFSLISGIFNDLWNAMGDFRIVYVFPLTLGVVLLLIGRLSRTSVKRSSGRGDDDA